MSPVLSILSMVVAFAVHAALCVTLLSAIGTLAARFSRQTSAPLRHTLTLSILLTIGITPAYVALRHWQPRAVEFASTAEVPSLPAIQVAEKSTGQFYPLDEEEMGTGVDSQATNGPISAGLRPTFIAFSVALLAWIAGILVLLTREIQRLREFWRLRSSLTLIDDPQTIALVDRLTTELRIRRRRVRVYTSSVAEPFTVGWLRPIVVVPSSFIERATPSQLEAVLVHELAHVRRGDWAIHIAMRLLAATYWWNILVRRLVLDLSRSREEICDNFVLKIQGNGRTLATVLVDTAARSIADTPLSWSLGMTVNEPQHLEKRVTQLLKDNQPMIRISSMFASFIFVTTLSIAALLVHADYAQAQEATTARFIPLGDLPGGGLFSRAGGISTDGSIVVGSSYSAQGDEAFSWTEAGGMIPLGDLPGGEFQSNAMEISTDGRIIIGFSQTAEGKRAVRWQDGVLKELGNVPEQDAFSDARSVSNDGTKITVIGHEKSYVWTEDAGFSPLGSIRYSKISGDGIVLAGHVDIEGVLRPAFYDQRDFTPLSELPDGTGTGHVWALSNDGSVVVGWAELHDGRWQAFRYENGIMNGLGFLGVEIASVARDVTADGSVVVGHANWQGRDNTDNALGFIWDSTNGMRPIQDVFENDFDMDLGGYRILSASSISADGRFIAGSAENPFGWHEAYVADLGIPVPEPSCGLMAACGAMIAGAFLLRSKFFS